MGKRIEGGIICVVTASQWVALFFAFHRLPLPVILTLLLSVYLSHHRQGGGVGVGYGEETRKPVPLPSRPSVLSKTSFGIGRSPPRAMAALRFCMATTPQ
jgi:hypothetical protein